MRLILAAFLFSLSSQSFASTCAEKQIFAASMKFAMDFKIAPTQVALVNYLPGAWTEAVGNNTGSDIVELRGFSNTTNEFVTKRYIVTAQQIGVSADCTVTGVTEDLISRFASL